ncbi:MAG: hypothetical protein AAB699_00325 [Patescibacteria group bacterium]
MRFQVPQFITVEDRIGPLTVKQYLYVVGGAGAGYIAWRFLPFYLSVFVIAPLALLSVLLAFVPVNGKPFIFTLQAAIQYLFANRLYLWKKTPKKPGPREEARRAPTSAVPRLSESKLKDLTWALDINQNIKR